MSRPRRAGLLPEPETSCASCGEQVSDHVAYAEFAINFGRRVGRFHLKCVPPEGLDSWIRSQSEFGALIFR